MKETKLKPCPFCGHSAIVVCNKYRHDKFSFCVQCGNTGTDGFDICFVLPQTYEYDEKTDAINAWNKRANSEQR